MQKAPIPVLDEIPVPQTESDSKKLQTQIKASNKTVVAPLVESTSVMPRQRPKGSSSTPLTLNNIPLTLSPSPKTVKKSESPVTLTDNQFHRTTQAAFNTNTQYSTAGNPSYPASTPFQSSQPFYPVQTTPEVRDKSLENLFQSSRYPDPFRDETANKIETEENPGLVNIVSPISPDQPISGSGSLLCRTPVKLGLVESTSQNIIGVIDTPPNSPSLSVPKGHRRNMSDTSAFNK